MELQKLNVKLPYLFNRTPAALSICYKDSWNGIKYHIDNYTNGSRVELPESMGVRLLDKISFVNAVVSTLDGLPEKAFAVVNDETVYFYKDEDLDGVVEKVLDSGYAQSGIKSLSQSIESHCNSSGDIGQPLTDLLNSLISRDYSLSRKEIPHVN